MCDISYGFDMDFKSTLPPGEGKKELVGNEWFLSWLEMSAFSVGWK